MGVDGRGGWNTTPFILATMAGLTLSSGGWMNNLIVYLIKEFNIKSIDAAQINNVINGCVNFFPLMAAIVADSFLGCFSVIWISSLFSLLGLVLLVLTATLDVLKPSKCESGTIACATPSTIQYAVLYASLALASIGIGGSRFTLATMGANQFTNATHQATYFNWYFVTMYVSMFISSTVIVYVEDNFSWAWGFGVCIVANVLALAIFVLGSSYYLRDKGQGSPFTSIARVVVASVRKRKVVVSSRSEDYYYGDGVEGIRVKAPTKNFRFLNRAALNTQRHTKPPNGSISQPCKLCTVQQVEDLKTLIKILPLWSSGILLGTPIGIQASLSILQALTTNRHMGPHNFQLPAGSMLVFTLLSTAICLTLFDRCLWPVWHKLSNKNITPLQQIGIGHVFNVASMAVSALVEAKRRNNLAPMSVLWLVPQLVIVGIGEAFHFPGQVGLYYKEFPSGFKSISTAMIALLIGTAFYMSTFVIGFVRRVTKWLPEDIDDGRMDNVYWVLVVIGAINFGYYLVCAWFYKYKDEEGDDQGGDHDLVIKYNK